MSELNINDGALKPIAEKVLAGERLNAEDGVEKRGRPHLRRARRPRIAGGIAAAGYWRWRVPVAIFRWGTWVLVAGMTLSALANFASPTVGERFFLGPSAVLLALLCLAATRVPAR